MDASGFWGVQKENDRILYHKEPVRSSEFINKKIWKDIETINPNLLICHSRKSSTSYGLPTHNINNHPFVNEDLSIALVHNGHIENNAYNKLLEIFEVISDCDSEVFLRIFLNEINKKSPSIYDRLSAVNNIWALSSDSFMAIAIGEIFENQRRLCLFRNQYKSLFLANVKSTNQLFFVSTKEIWEESVKHIEVKYEIEEIPCSQAWMLDVNSNIIKFTLNKKELNPIIKEKTKKPEINEKIYTNLNENEDVCFTKEVVTSLCENINFLSNEIKNNFNTQEYAEIEIRDCSHKLAFIKKEILNVLNFIKK